MQIPTLTPRLQTIANLINNSRAMADIGTDHAYLPLYLITNGRCSFAIASDIRKGPLARAEETFKKYGMKDKIELRLGAGLETVSEDDNIDTIVIAGMGGLVISDIIENSINIVKSAKHIILQPMTMAPKLREYLYKSAFGTIAEHLAFEGDKIYNIISVKINSNTTPINLMPLDAYIGKSLIETKPDGFEVYVNSLAQKLESQIHGLSGGTTAEAEEKLENVKNLLSEVKKIQHTEV